MITNKDEKSYLPLSFAGPNLAKARSTSSLTYLISKTSSNSNYNQTIPPQVEFQMNASINFYKKMPRKV